VSGWHGPLRFELGVAALLLTMLAACGPPAESRALSDVIRGAQTAELNLANPPSHYHIDGVGADALQPMLDHAQAELSKYYAGDLLRQKISTHQDGIRGLLAAKAGGRVGGVSAIDLQDVRVSGRTAQVKARVTVWFKTAQFWWQDPSSRPSATNVMDLDLHLIRADGAWKIDRETWRFAPGGGP
jgi:hypothetical protein